MRAFSGRRDFPDILSRCFRGGQWVRRVQRLAATLLLLASLPGTEASATFELDGHYDPDSGLVELSWLPGAARYDVYRSGIVIASGSENSYTGILPGSASYWVIAYWTDGSVGSSNAYTVLDTAEWPALISEGDWPGTDVQGPFGPIGGCPIIVWQLMPPGAGVNLECIDPMMAGSP